MSGFPTGPGLYEAWGLTNGQFSPESLGDLAASWGFGWVAVEDGTANRALGAGILARIAARGVQVVVWGQQDTDTATANDAIAFWNPSAYIVNQERPVSGTGFSPAALRAAHPSLPLAVITNLYAGMESEGWVANGFYCMPEAYTVDSPTETLANMIVLARSKGWVDANIFPTIGVYHGFPAGAYNSQFAAIAPLPSGWSLYLAETATPTDFQQLKDGGHLGGSAPGPTPPPPNPPGTPNPPPPPAPMPSPDDPPKLIEAQAIASHPGFRGSFALIYDQVLDISTPPLEDFTFKKNGAGPYPMTWIDVTAFNGSAITGGRIVLLKQESVDFTTDDVITLSYTAVAGLDQPPLQNTNAQLAAAFTDQAARVVDDYEPPSGPGDPGTPEPSHPPAGYETAVLAMGPLAYWRLGELTKEQGDPLVDTTGNYPGVYEMGGGAPIDGYERHKGSAALGDNLQCCDDDGSAIFYGNVDFVSGEPAEGGPGAAGVVELATGLDFSGQAPFSVMFWLAGTNLKKGKLGGALGKIYQWRTGYFDTLNGGIMGTRKPASAGGQTGWHIWNPPQETAALANVTPTPELFADKMHQIRFQRQGTFVEATVADHFGTGPYAVCPPSDSHNTNTLVFCIYDGETIAIYTAGSILAFQAGVKKDNPWLDLQYDASVISGPENPGFTMGSVNYNLLVTGYWGNCSFLTLDDVAIFARALTLEEMLKLIKCSGTARYINKLRKIKSIKPAPNDSFARAHRLPGRGAGVAPGWQYAGNTEEDGEPTPSAVSALYQSVWYRWKAPQTGTLSITTTGSVPNDNRSGVGSPPQLYTALAVYTGSSLGALVEVGSGDDASNTNVLVPVVSGTDYYIQVGSAAAGVNGDALLSWSVS